MKKAKIFLILFAILAVFFIVAAFVIKYNGDNETREARDSVASEADMTIKNIHYVKTHLGIKEWELEASSGQYFRNKKISIFKNVRIKVFLKDGKPMTLIGDEGKVTTDSRDIKVWGNVIASSEEGFQFYTQSLEYCSEKRSIFTNDKIAFFGNGIEVRGVGITIDVDRQRFFVLNDVATTLKKARMH